MEVQMLVVQGKQRGKMLRFHEGEFIFGRGPECHVRPESDWVSRQHCMLRVHPAGVSNRDLGSTNGTLINGQRVTDEQELQSGDRLQLGPLVLELVLPATAAAFQDTHVVDLGNTAVANPEQAPPDPVADTQVAVTGTDVSS